jgi:hypothetical protein
MHSVIMQDVYSLATSDGWTQSTHFDESLLKTANGLNWSRSIAALNLVFCTLKFLDLGKGLQYDFTIIVITMFDMLKRMIQFIMVLIIFGFAWWFFTLIMPSRTPDSAFLNVWSGAYASFQYVMGDVDYGDVQETQGWFSSIGLVFFVLGVVLLLNNFLIAFMGDAYEESKEFSKASFAYLQFIDIEDRDNYIKIKNQRCNCFGSQTNCSLWRFAACCRKTLLQRVCRCCPKRLPCHLSAQVYPGRG